MKDTAVTTDEGFARSVLQCLAWMWCKHTLSAVPLSFFFSRTVCHKAKKHNDMGPITHGI